MSCVTTVNWCLLERPHLASPNIFGHAVRAALNAPVWCSVFLVIVRNDVVQMKWVWEEGKLDA